MSYEIMATSKTPALIIYLLAMNASMSQPLGGKRRIDVVMDALAAALRQLVFHYHQGQPPLALSTGQHRACTQQFVKPTALFAQQFMHWRQT